MLSIRNRSRICDVVIGPLSPQGRAICCVRVGVNTVCASEYVFMMSMKVLCSWRLFVWGMMGAISSVSGESKGDITVQSMSGKLKSPVIHISWSASMRDKDSSRFCRYSMLVEGGL